MTTTHYRAMTERQGADALEEFLAERAPALERLRAGLTVHGLDPETLLDGTPESLTPLWRWVTGRLLELEAQPQIPAAPLGRCPSWARYTATGGTFPLASAEAIALLDGVVSYLAEVITAAAPTAVWRVGHRPVEAYHLQNHPVLTSAVTDDQVFLPGVPRNGVVRLLHGVAPLGDDLLCEHAADVIISLRGDVRPAPAPSEPPVEVLADGDGFDVAVRADLAHEHSPLVDRMVAELALQDGVEAAFREGRGVLLVRAPDWCPDRLEQWLLSWCERHIPPP